MITRHYKVISFDLDDTLWHVAPVIEKANRQTYQWLVQHCPKVIDHFKPQQLLTIKDELLRERPELAHQISELRIQALQQALCHAGYSQQQAHQLALDAFEVFIAARNEVEFFDYALESLEVLKEYYILGVLTNGNACIERLGLDKYFSFAFSAEQLNASKPAPDHFLAALQHTGEQTHRMIHVGDHQEHDVWAAQQLGITTVWLNWTQELWRGEKPPDSEINNLKELVGAIDRLETSYNKGE